ncbi:MAG: hypothetical protein EHM68_10835 [Lysobacterales bacterium]|nr:MAG: hypothetical protein EHM68_10835 [Xanthomonadales bacterium]
MNDGKSGKPHRSFGLVDFLWRWAAALVLVFVTYNPAGRSYFHWAKATFVGEGLEPVHYFVGVILVAGWTIFVIATARSLGALGTIIGAALVGTGIWLLVDIGLLHADSVSTIAWLTLFALGTLLAIGLSWSHIWLRLSGQLEVDED